MGLKNSSLRKLKEGCAITALKFWKMTLISAVVVITASPIIMLVCKPEPEKMRQAVTEKIEQGDPLTKKELNFVWDKRNELKPKQVIYALEQELDVLRKKANN